MVSHCKHSQQWEICREDLKGSFRMDEGSSQRLLNKVLKAGTHVNEFNSRLELAPPWTFEVFSHTIPRYLVFMSGLIL
ncbi:hypothetical protein VCHA54O482_90081 [Vibrio chagasii]|nr:hypothetical protein VCHA36O163_100081 [Vibrio chagasii]CAH6795533.1 hypothetical protein VCHA31O71_100081 [Vibrio chagasii]CAH7441454.1 hypothetical protein VCHA49P382_90091 [Vibrio chagasii]CAH7481567.1 hypothetical protein VCHA54O482_90081 [Vibrio chagasii]